MEAGLTKAVIFVLLCFVCFFFVTVYIYLVLMTVKISPFLKLKSPSCSPLKSLRASTLRT